MSEVLHEVRIIDIPEIGGQLSRQSAPQADLIVKPFFTCYVDGSGTRWRATCVDFDLTVFGSSIEEVKKLLNLAVATYIADANAESAADRDRLLGRRSPWYVRLGWRLSVLRTKVGTLFGVQVRPADRILMPCPA